jgi:hypothetical protein
MGLNALEPLWPGFLPRSEKGKLSGGLALKPRILARHVVSWVPASATCRRHSCAGAAGAAAAALRLTTARWWVSGFLWIREGP